MTTRAVFIGSSNAYEWPEILCARQGWILHDHHIPGSGFSSSSTSRFLAQLWSAIGDQECVADEVGFVFIVDAGNDIRGMASVAPFAPDVFALASIAFPNARIIVLPVLWGIADLNRIPARILSISQRMQEINEAALPWPVEIIDRSWTWHYDYPGWMLPASPTESGVHYTPAGRERVVHFVERFLRGLSTNSPIGWKYIFGTSSHVNPGNAWVRARRDWDETIVQGRLSLVAAAGPDTHLGWLAPGLTPLENVRVPVISDTRQTGYVDIFPSGQIRSFTSLAADTWNFNQSYPTF